MLARVRVVLPCKHMTGHLAAVLFRMTQIGTESEDGMFGFPFSQKACIVLQSGFSTDTCFASFARE